MAHFIEDEVVFALVEPVVARGSTLFHKRRGSTKMCHGDSFVDDSMSRLNLSASAVVSLAVTLRERLKQSDLSIISCCKRSA